jgi:predicted site-specific integrase-resolvase
VKKGTAKPVRCAIYTRVSTDHGLEQDFNSLDAQHDAAQAYIRSQAHAGWTLIRSRYDDGGYSGGSTERPALQRLLADVRTRKVDVIVVYKVDRLTRSLADFAKLVELFDDHGVSFVSVTQQFNTTTSMGRLTLNVLLSFAQFEREVTSALHPCSMDRLSGPDPCAGFRRPRSRPSSDVPSASISGIPNQPMIATSSAAMSSGSKSNPTSWRSS